MELGEGRSAWLTLTTTSDYRRLVGGDKYDDNPSTHYSWNSLVNHHSVVHPGDVLVLWNKKVLLGVSTVEQIDIGDGIAKRGLCVACGRASISARKRKTPKYKCSKCKAEFNEDPTIVEIPVTTYRSHHSQAWVPMEALLDGNELRSLCKSPRSQDSFRPLRWDAFQDAVLGAVDGNPLKPLELTGQQIAGGHKVTPVRIRRGQATFRARLLEQYGAHCALTGPSPVEVLDACHLYSYAHVGEHKDQGGLLLRRDLHTLFDRGLLAVDSSGTIDLAEAVRKYPTYAPLHGSVMQVPLAEKQKQWLQLHWIEHRTDD